MKHLFIIYLLLVPALSIAQQRVQISGYLQNELDEPLEGIAIFNENSLEGTVSNGTGSFEIKVMPNDRITFKTVNYDAVTLIVTERTMNEKILALRLKEGINVLKEVVLTGSHYLDIELNKLKESDPKLEKVTGYGVAWTPAVDRIENTFSDLTRQPEDYPIRNEALIQNQPRVQMFNLIGLLAAVILNIAANLIDLDFGGATTTTERLDVTVLKNELETAQLVEFLDIPRDQLYEYLYFATDQGLTPHFIENSNELEILDFLSKKATEFKKRKQ